MRAAVEVAEVAVHLGRVEASDSPAYALPVTGSVPGVHGVQAIVGGEPVGEAAVAADGTFALMLNTLEFEPGFTVELSADRTRPVATIEGRRLPLPPPPPGSLEPLLIPTMGRSGTSWLVRLLGEHPAVVAHRSFELEPRAVLYWANVVRGLADPAAHWQLLARGAEPRWWLGDGGGAENTRWADPELRAELGREAVDDLCHLAHRRVERFYRAAARLADRGGARCFVEKSERDWRLLRLAAEIWPSSRDIVLVRDFRDVVASVFAFNERRGARAFGRQRVGSDEEFLDFVRDYATGLARWRRSRGTRARVVRYEDLILEPEPTLTGLLGWLGLDPDRALVAEMLASASHDTPQMADHRTAAGPRESVGRWERDLPPALRERAAEVLAEPLAEFGY